MWPAPRPRRRASDRLRASSTSVRRRGSGSSRRTAPSASWREALPAPKRGVKSRPQRSTVPVPSASGTNDSGCCPAASRAARRDSPSSAGRSPSRAATGTPDPAARIPAQMASLSPVPGSGTTCTPRARQAVDRPSSLLTRTRRSGSTACRAAESVSVAIAALRSGRSEPTARARRDLPWLVSLTGTTTCQRVGRPVAGYATGYVGEEVDMLAISSHSPRCCSTPRREVDKMKASHVDRRVHDEKDVTT